MADFNDVVTLTCTRGQLSSVVTFLLDAADGWNRRIQYEVPDDFRKAGMERRRDRILEFEWALLKFEVSDEMSHDFTKEES